MLVSEGYTFFSFTSYLSDRRGAPGHLVSCIQKVMQAQHGSCRTHLQACLRLRNGNNSTIRHSQEPPLTAGRRCQMCCGCQRKYEKMAACYRRSWTCIRTDHFISVTVYYSAVTLSIVDRLHFLTELQNTIKSCSRYYLFSPLVDIYSIFCVPG